MTVESLRTTRARTRAEVRPGERRGAGARRGGATPCSRRFGILDSQRCSRRRDASGRGGVPRREGTRQVARERRCGAVGGGEADLRGRRGYAPGREHPAGSQALAKTLRDIARAGPAGFYSRRRPARSIGGVMIPRWIGGRVRRTSRRSSRSGANRWSWHYKGTEVFEVPPNSMGATTLLILELLEECRPRLSRASARPRGCALRSRPPRRRTRRGTRSLVTRGSSVSASTSS